MEHEMARKGIGQVFTSQILMIVGTVCTLITAIFAGVAIAAMASESAGGMFGAGIGSAIFAIAAAVLGIIGFILNLVGLNKAGQDNAQIKSAFTLSIIALIIGIIGGILSASLGTSYSWINSIVELIQAIIALVITYKVLMGCAELNPALQDKANSVWKVYLCLIILDIVVTIVAIILGVMGVTGVSAIAFILIAVIDFVFDIVAYFMYLSFLGRARKEV